MTMPDAPGSDGLVAAVDCGTNSTRLLIARVGAPAGGDVVRRTQITRLGAAVDATGRLSDAAIGRVAEVLEDYATAWRAAGVARVGITATSAVRDAADAHVFLDAVEAVAGVRPVVLSGSREAELVFSGATAGRSGRQVVCDIGGGSTELIVGDDVVWRCASLQIGSVRLRERHLAGDPPTPAEYAALVADADAHLAELPDAFAQVDGRPLVAVAGTALTVAAIARGVDSADIDRMDGTVMAAAEVAEVAERLAWVPAADRLAYPPIVPGREDVIVAGALVLTRVLARFGFDAVEVRVADLLDGVAARVAAGTWPPPRPLATAP